MHVAARPVDGELAKYGSCAPGPMCRKETTWAIDLLLREPTERGQRGATARQPAASSRHQTPAKQWQSSITTQSQRKSSCEIWYILLPMQLVVVCKISFGN